MILDCDVEVAIIGQVVAGWDVKSGNQFEMHLRGHAFETPRPPILILSSAAC